MRTRLIITCIWLLGLIAAFVLLESYAHTFVDGQPIAFQPDVMESLEPISILYGFYLAGILGFWYFKPFPRAKTKKAESARALIAIVTTLLLNAGILFNLGYAHIYGLQGLNIQDYAAQAVTLAKWFSFLVAPANAYYFGMAYRKT